MNTTYMKEILIKILVFVNCSLTILPWASEIFSWSFGPYWIVKLFGCWLLLAIFALTIVIILFREMLKKLKVGVRVLITTILGILSSFFISYLMTQGVYYFYELFILLGLITLFIWVMAVYIAGIYPYTELLNLKHLCLGLLSLSLYSLYFNSGNSLEMSWTCFILYLALSSLLFVFSAGKNVRMVGFGVGFIILVCFIIGALRGFLLNMIYWIYINIVAKLLMVFINIITFFSTDLFILEAKSRPGTTESESNFTESLDNFENMYQTSNQQFSPIVKRSAVLFVIFLACLAAFLIIQAVLKRLYFKKKKEELEIEEKEFILPDISLSVITRRTSRLISKVRQSIYGTSLEEKVRKMIKEILLLAKKTNYPIKPSTTPNEVENIITQKKHTQDPLIKAYNDVRYGEKTLSQQDFDQAAVSYQNIRSSILKIKK
jgi:hypothetical protein